MDCPPSSVRKTAFLKDIKARLARLVCIFSRAAKATGWDAPEGPIYAALQTRTYSGGKWKVSWLSTPGRYYTVQTSYDGGQTWFISAIVVPAAEEPAVVTEWESVAVAYREAYFRIIALPENFEPCYSQSAGVLYAPGWDVRNDPLASLS